MSPLLRFASRVRGPLSRRRRHALAAAAFACAVLAFASFDARAGSAASHDATATAARSSPTLVAAGHALFEESCASCHGLGAQGIAGRGPSLHGVGALAADFYLETGRMPLAAPRQQPVRARPAFPQSQIRALIAYVASFGGPAIPAVDPAAGSVSRGEQLFALDCAGCHTIQGRGGVVTGAFVPALTPGTPRQVGEAIRIGPYAMPPFAPGQLSDAQVDSIARYVQTADHPQDPGGWDIGRIGPITEGMAAWLLAIAALLIVARLLGERTAAAPPERR